MKTRLLIFLNAILFLCIANVSVFQKEKILNQDESIVLALAPVDPRSLIQGDYMNIRYAITSRVTNLKGFTDGYIYVKKDARGVYQFSRISDLGGNVEDGERKIRFRKRGFQVKIGAESYFFQEGDGKYFENAKYGVLKVSGDGEVILVGLMDENLRLIQPEREIQK